MLKKIKKIYVNYLNKFKLGYLSSLRDILKSNPQEVYYVHELSGLVIFYLASLGLNLEKNSRIIYDAHEYEIYRNPPKPYLLRSIISHIESFCIIKLNAEIVTVSDSIALLYQKRLLRKSTVINNLPSPNVGQKKVKYKVGKLGADFSEVNHAFQNGLIEQHVKNLKSGVLIGKITINRGIEEVLLAMAQMPSPSFNLFLIGDGTTEYLRKLSNLVRDLELKDHVYWVRPVENSQVVNLISEADFSIVSVIPIALSYYACAPNKLFESMAAKLPIAYTGSVDTIMLCDVHRIVSKIKCGAPINFLDPKSAARDLNDFCSNLKRYSAGYADIEPKFYDNLEELEKYKILLI